MTADGSLTTLVVFTGVSGSNRGTSPNALVEGRDGNFYGTTKLGGTNDLGTLFQMTPQGILTTLIDFSGNSGSYRGYFPLSDLVQGADGKFYGTTLFGGAHFSGTIFSVTSNGVFTTLVEFGDGEQTQVHCLRAA